MEGTQGLQGRRIALLIDFDNVELGVEPPGFDPALVVNALRSRGIVVLGRAYGDWYRHNRHRRKLMEQGIELVETPAFGPIIKNSADIRIALDGFEIGMTQHHIDAFCIVSGDSDFLPLIKKLQYLGKHVIVIAGNKFTSDLVRRNCNEFISYENLLAESLGATEDVSTLDGALTLLVRGVSTLHERGMEVRSSTVKQMMLQLNPAFSERNFGCAQFKGFLDKAVKAGAVKLGQRDVSSGEFSVFLPGDFDDDVPAKTATTPVETAPRERGRGRGRREAAPPAKIEPLVTEEITPHSEAAAPEDIRGATPGALLDRGLRRGRLKFSGKSGRAATVTEPAAETSPATEPVEEPVVEETAPVVIGMETSTEEAMTETDDSVPKKKPTRRGGKVAKAKAAKKAAKAGEDTSSPSPEPAAEPPAAPEPTAPNPVEVGLAATEDKPKRPTRRKAPVRKKAE